MKFNITRKITEKEGFTLVELMIVVAIIGILAAIAIPQFVAYRTRSFNAAAKAVAHNLVGTQSDLQSELGAYGHSETAPATLVGALVGVGIVDSNGDPANAIGATAANAGGRLIGTNATTAKIFAVSFGYGADMEAHSFVDATTTSYIAIARHFNGDTQYGIDGDVTNIIYSGSNPAWVGVAMVAADTAEPLAAVAPLNDDFAGGLGCAACSALDPTWQPVQ